MSVSSSTLSTVAVQLDVNIRQLEDLFQDLKVSEQEQQALTDLLAQANDEQAEVIGAAIERGQIHTVQELGAVMRASGMDLRALGGPGPMCTDPAHSASDEQVAVREGIPRQPITA